VLRVDSAMSATDRQRVLDQSRRARRSILVNARLLATGVDVPEVEGEWDPFSSSASLFLALSCPLFRFRSHTTPQHTTLHHPPPTPSGRDCGRQAVSRGDPSDRWSCMPRSRGQALRLSADPSAGEV
jgi:hypothetical protein